MSQAAVVVERRFQQGLLDAYTATRRFLIRGKRQPDVIFGSLLTPVIFVVLFGYVFGSSISVPGGNYRSFLMPGLFAMSVLFSAANVAVAVATDMSEGVVDRFKTLPIARSAIVIGRSLSTLILGIPVLVVMIACGLAVGWRADNGLGNAVLAFLLWPDPRRPPTSSSTSPSSSWDSSPASSSIRRTCPSGCATSRTGTPCRHWWGRAASSSGTRTGRHRQGSGRCNIRS
jgi:hypothetical protein